MEFNVYSDFNDDFLSSLYRRRGGIKLGLGRVVDAFPQIFERPVPVYHVAGTNGKGTTVYAIDEILRSSGLKTGRFVSPHLISYNERIAVDNSDISNDAVVDIYKYLEKKLSNFDELSFFEITFLIAWKFFEIEKCDRAVFEVGLGGRLDATNVIEGPKTDLITSIGLDHTHILGDTLEKIAIEKLGIVKENDSVFIASSADPVFDRWMEDYAISRGAALVTDEKHGFDIEIKGENFSQEQIKDIDLAVNATLCAENYLIKIPDFSKMRLPGRFERIGDNIIVDVAHNPPAMEALSGFVKRKGLKTAVLFGALKDKAIGQLLDIIGKITDNIFVVSLTEENRSTTVQDIVDAASESVAGKLKYAENDEKTILEALKFAKDNDLELLVCGSFHTVEKFIRHFYQKP